MLDGHARCEQMQLLPLHQNYGHSGEGAAGASDDDDDDTDHDMRLKV